MCWVESDQTLSAMGPERQTMRPGGGDHKPMKSREGCRMEQAAMVEKSAKPDRGAVRKDQGLYRGAVVERQGRSYHSGA